MATFTNPSGMFSSSSSFATDMFGRTKVAEPHTLFDSQHRYHDNGDYSDTTVNGATVSYNANQSSVLLNVGVLSGSEVTRESKKVFPYQPGKSLQVMQTFVMAPAHVNLRQRVGYFSRQNGFYLEQDGMVINFVKRTFVNGSVEEIRIPQSQWNMDKLNGLGPSGINLDLSKAQILFSEYEWLGVGSVKLGFAINGNFIIAHQFNHANLLDSVYITTATLPIRYEITNKELMPTSSTMKQICATVISNGGYSRETERWTVANPNAITTSTSFKPVASIRMGTGRTDAVILISGIGLMPTGAGNVEWALFRDPTLNASTWTLHAASGNNIEYNTDATTMSNGTIVRQGYFAGSNQASGAVDIYEGLNTFDLQLGRTNASIPVSEIYTLGVRTVTGTTGVYGSLSWYDLS